MAVFILAATLLGLLGIILSAIIYYATRTKAQKQARRKEVAKIWKDNDKLAKKLTKSSKKK